MTFKGTTGEITEVHSCTELLCLEWRIPHFFSAKPFDYYNSPRFFFYNLCWHMKVFPNWSSSAYVDFWLQSQNPGGSTIAVRVTVGMKVSAGFEIKKEKELKIENRKGWSVLKCSREKLNELKDRLMLDDPLTIVCEIKILQSVKVPPVNNEEEKVFIEESESSEKGGMEELQDSLRSLLKGGEDCDVTIKVRDKEFRVHRLIMRARSPVFHAMFSHNMLEKQKGVVTMNDTDPETFPEFLEHVYTGSVGMISADNVISLFVTSDKYDLKTLRRECARFMRENMTVASFCDVVSVAVRHNEEELLQRATEFFCNNSLDIIKTVEWQIFLKENTTVGNELLIKLLSK